MIVDICPECGDSRVPQQRNIFGEPERLTHACSECNGMYYGKVNVKTDSMTVSEFIIKDSGRVSEDSTLVDWSIDNDFVIISKWVLEDGETFEEEHCPGAFMDWIVRGRTRY